jgi:hypothetical protein
VIERLPHARDPGSIIYVNGFCPDYADFLPLCNPRLRGSKAAYGYNCAEHSLMTLAATNCQQKADLSKWGI